MALYMTLSSMETFPLYWPFVAGIHRSSVNYPHKGQWSGALVFSLICAWANGWVNNRDAGDLRRHRAHYDVTVMSKRGHWGTTLQRLGYRQMNNVRHSHSSGPIYHYNDVMISANACQVTSLTIVCSTVYSGADERNIKARRHWSFSGEFTPVTGEFPAHMASNTEYVSIWWHHHDTSAYS